MKIPQNHPSFLLVSLAICETLRHTGTNEVTQDISSQIHGPKAEKLVERLNFSPPPPVLDLVKIYFKNDDTLFSSPIDLKPKGSSRKKFTEIVTNTASLRHYKNPQQFRRR